MKPHKNILKFISKPFIKLKNDRITGFFWNSLIFGFFLLPLAIRLSTPFFIVAIISGIVIAYNNRNKIVYKDFSFLSYPILFLLMGISIFYSKNTDVGLKLLERTTPLFFFPLILFFIKEDLTITKKIINSLLCGLLVSLVINLFQAFSNSLVFLNSGILFDASIEGGYSFWESFSHGGSHFIGGEFSKFVPPSYLSLYILTVIIFIQKHNNFSKGIKRLVYFSLFLYLFLLASRASFAILILLSIVNVMNVKSIKLKIARAIFLISIGFVVYNLNPRTQILYERLIEFTEKENFNYTTSEQSRILTFITCIKLIGNAPIFGYGIGDANDELIKEYKNSGYSTNAKNKYNAHNQYFQTMLQVGLAGVLLLIAPLLITVFKTKNIYVWSMLIVFTTSLLFESMLIRYNGIVFFSIFIPLLARKERTLV